MKVILQNAITLNGLIAGENHNTNWVSDADWQSFVDLANKVGNIIIGRTTYEVMKKAGEVNNYANLLIVVLTKNKNLEREGEKIAITSKKPKDVLKMMEEKGYKEVLIAGGGKLNASFIKEGLIDEIFFDVHPIILGKGTQVFAADEFQYKLKLLESKKLSENVVQLHYKVIK